MPRSKVTTIYPPEKETVRDGSEPPSGGTFTPLADYHPSRESDDGHQEKTPPRPEGARD